MGIETLYKAAGAAGFAMATADDEPVELPMPVSASRALVPFVAEPPSLVPPPKAFTEDAIGTAGDWLRGCLPALGRRATA